MPPPNSPPRTQESLISWSETYKCKDFSGRMCSGTFRVSSSTISGGFWWRKRMAFRIQAVSLPSPGVRQSRLKAWFCWNSPWNPLVFLTLFSLLKTRWAPSWLTCCAAKSRERQHGVQQRRKSPTPEGLSKWPRANSGDCGEEEGYRKESHCTDLETVRRTGPPSGP